MKKYEMNNASSVRKSLQALLEKELVLETFNEEKTVYQVYDVFLTRWFQMKGR